MREVIKSFLVFVSFLSFLTFRQGWAESPGPTDLQGQISGEFERHNYKKVVQLYKEYQEGHPDTSIPPVVRVFYSQALADMGDLDEAIKSLRETLAALSPQVDTFKLQYDLANLLFLQKRYEEAKAAFQKIVIESAQHTEIANKAKERINLMKSKAKDSGAKKDFVSLQLLDIETALDAGEVPDAAEILLQQIAEQNPTSPQAEQARRLQVRLKEVRTQKAKALLDEARRLFDEEKKYTEVREILGQISKSYSDVCEAASVEALLKAVSAKDGKGIH